MSAAPPRLDRSPDRSIVLVGMMGSGKSSIGRRLASRLGLPFVDADQEIEHSSGHTIEALFERFGEAGFRDCERRVIARLVEGPRRVIATGGGAFADERTRALILERCTAIWLDADIDTLVARVSRRGGRPLLRGRDPRRVIEELAAKRNPSYAEAHLRIRSAPAPHDAVVAQICRELHL